MDGASKIKSPWISPHNHKGIGKILDKVWVWEASSINGPKWYW